MRFVKAKSETENQNLSNGGTVRVKLECAARTTAPGELVTVNIIVSADGNAVEAKGVFVDLTDTEEIALKHLSPAIPESFLISHQAMNETFRIAKPFALAAGETGIFAGKFRLPINFQPTFAGQFSRHDWQIRARVETLEGNADSGFQSFKIGAGF